MLDLFRKKPADKHTWAVKLKQSLSTTRERLSQQLSSLFSGGKLDEATLEQLESILLSADVGIEATAYLLADLQKQGSKTDPMSLLQESLLRLLSKIESPLQLTAQRPFVIMLVGVNGAGKTTSIGKLARYFQEQSKSVLLAAGDTFRAAAREQLRVWGERNQVVVVAQEQGDPAAVMYDAVQAAKSRQIDIVLADTAGRLPTQLHLMEELKKVKRVLAKAEATAPHEILLVLDGNTGQNALTQVQAFDAALGLSGLMLTKLDGSAKGGVIAAIAKNKPIPLRFIGVGEGIEDLQPFRAADYVTALFEPAD